MKFLFTVRKRVLFTILAFMNVFLLSTSLVTSSTEAYYSDSEQWDSVIQAGTWRDKSNLQFTTNLQQHVNSCKPVKITTGITNKGFSMIGTTEYEVYYAEDQQSNQKVAEGIIEKMKTNSTLNLTHQADKPGTYTFKIFQRPGYQENDESRSVVWSEKINVTCMDKSTEEKATVEEVEETSVPIDNEGSEQENTSNEEHETETIGQEQQEQQEQVEEEQQVQEVHEVPEAQVDEQKQNIQEEQDERRE